MGLLKIFFKQDPEKTEQRGDAFLKAFDWGRAKLEFEKALSLVVCESARGKGVGKELLFQAKKWAREESISKIRVRANSLRKGSHEFYIKQSYHEVKSQKIFQDAV